MNENQERMVDAVATRALLLLAREYPSDTPKDLTCLPSSVD